MEEKEYFEWSNLYQKWIETLYTWDDVAITRKVDQAFGGNPSLGIPGKPHQYLQAPQVAKNALTKKEYKKFVSLVCRVNGITTHTLKERNPDCELTVMEISRTLDEVLRPQVKLTNIGKKDI